MDKRIGEKHNELTIIATSTKPANGYLKYYWCLCSCGNIKRYRYDQLRRVGSCGMCDDIIESGVIRALEGFNNGNK